MSALAPLRLSRFLPYRLSVLSQTLSRRLAARYGAAFALTAPQWRVMAVLGETPGLSATQTAERTAMDKVAVSRAVAALSDRGYVRRRASDTDGRASLLDLTPGGEDVYRHIAPIALAYERELTAHLTPEEARMLMGLLDRLAVAASPETPLW